MIERLQFLAEDAPGPGGGEALPAAEPASPSIVDAIVAFDPTPHLGGVWLDAWNALQQVPLLFAVLLVALGYGVGRLLKWMIHVLLERIAKNHISDLDYQIAHYLTAPILQTAVAFAIILAFATLEFPGAIEHLLVRVCITGLLLLWGRAWFRATRAILRTLEAERDRYRLFQPRTVPLYEMGIKLLLVGLFVYLLFLVWGIDATAWVASAGIIGIVVGFAARDTLANLISGVSIVADAPYKIGDYIVLDSGERGVVSALGIRSTRLMTRDDVEVSIPNAVIGSAKIVNESGGPYVRHRIRIPVGVAYDSDIDRVIEVLSGVAGDHGLIVDEPAPRVRIRGFGDSSVNLELLGWIRRPADRGLVIHELSRDILRRFREAGIEIPFPQRDLHVRGERKAGEEKPPG